MKIPFQDESLQVVKWDQGIGPIAIIVRDCELGEVKGLKLRIRGEDREQLGCSGSG